MIGIFRFKLPEEQEEFEAAQAAMAVIGHLQQYDNYLRGRLKYEELDPKVQEALQEARTKLHEEIEIWG